MLPPPVPVLKAKFRFEGNTTAVSSEGGVPVGAVVTVDAGDSQSLFPENLLYEWSLIEKPSDSAAQLSPSEGAVAQFTADRAGIYTIRLHLEDGYNENHAELSLSALAAEDAAPPPPAPAPQDPASPPAAGGCSLQPVAR